jgi:hypothetical protein
MSEIKNKYKQIIKYLKGILSNRERHELERNVMRDVFEEEAFEGLTRLSADELESDLDILTNRLEERIKPVKKRNLLPYYRLAASIVLLIGIGCILYFVFRIPSRNLVTENTSAFKIPAPAEIKVPALKDTLHVAENKSARTIIKEKNAQALPENLRESATEPEPVSETVAPGAIAAEEKKQIQYKSKVPFEDAVTVRYGEAKKADDTGALSGIEENEIPSDSKAKPDGYIKPIPPGESIEAFKNWVNERIDSVQLKAFTGKYRISVEFTVQTDGTLHDITINNAIPAPIAGEYKRIITQSPSWKPALRDNTPVEAQVVVRFIITIK